MKSTSIVSLSLLWAVVASTGCNTSAEGALGSVIFTPKNCGRVGCDFDDSVGVGGVLELQIQGARGVSTAGVTLASSDESVLTVTPIPDVGDRPAWELVGVSAGVAEILALDAGGDDKDFLEVAVQELSSLALVNVLGDAVGPDLSHPAFDEVWTINADEAVSFQVTPLIGEGVPTMGVYAYTATIDAAVEDGLLDPDLSEGYLYFSVPAGQHVVSFEDDFGHDLEVLLVARASGAR